MTKTVVIHSGGMDSTVLLYHLREQGHEVLSLGVNYKQRHLKELGFAAAICHELGVKQQIADLSNVAHLFGGDSALVDYSSPVPDGHYTDESMKATVVPNRNMIMLAVATGYAIAQKCDVVAYGAHAGDHAIYPDCRSEFADAMARAVALCDWTLIRLMRPFVAKTKAEICRLGSELGVPFEKTWSCYKGSYRHCGACGTCVERREAFHLAGVKDPTVYGCE
jgi:7-cyano-7-deazaguanine synthase